MKIVSLLPRAVKEEGKKPLTTQKCCICGSVRFLSLSVISVYFDFRLSLF